ncbi:hypothetical protein RHGRI_027931 [Rhododendron griersonianum]|uniref:Uncharacterized protein n=1 Tax=Rhododendron griersonianum TaxID=479676 RepID=A0AAV6J2A0_9ERIC|nr:hypothetical protein RHGRI_027931 [Rhododendron griersonianum]
MMGSFPDQEEEYQFFDAHEGIASPGSSFHSLSRRVRIENSVSSSFEYELWTRSPKSVQERRSKFLNRMGLNSNGVALDDLGDECGDLLTKEMDRITRNSGAVLRTQIFQDEFSSSRSSWSSWSNDASGMSEEESHSKLGRTGNLGGGTESNVDELGNEAMLNKLQVSSLDRLVMPEKVKNNFASSTLVSQPRETEVADNFVGSRNMVKKKWLSRLRSFTCMVDREGVGHSLRRTPSKPIQGARVHRVKVRHSRKRWKELSALFMGQDIKAHEGSILTMKFSVDGQYLATAGEDGIVCVWQVVEDARSNEIDIPEIDPSCVYFTVNHLSELAPFVVAKDKLGKLKSLRKTADSACVIFPPKVFRILEKPLHQLHGHSNEILDLSWSKNNCLLSSSVDKTVRLWKVGCEHCLKVFSHSNYVTCIQFNPVDDNHFVSGSIDGKVRIWEITGCQVVDWTDIKDIVTAVCYRPDGKGVIVGSMTGTCRFYDISSKPLFIVFITAFVYNAKEIAISDHFQLEAQIDLHIKKKAPCKRITGFQFFPQDPSRLMVTCADSQVRVLHGINVVGKYRGLRSTKSQLYASFTPDGKHIVSTSEDSNVYIWNCNCHEDFSPSQQKVIRSWERFSTNASVAIPWSGLKKSGESENVCQVPLPFSSPSYFSLGQEFVLESFPRGSATWPEEKLLKSSSRAVASAMHKSQYNFLRNCQSASSSHAWDLVIVTAGWDGRIRSFHNYGLPVAV